MQIVADGADLLRCGYQHFSFPHFIDDTGYVVYPKVEFFVHWNGYVYVYDPARNGFNSGPKYNSLWMLSSIEDLDANLAGIREEYKTYRYRMARRHCGVNYETRRRMLHGYLLRRFLRRFI